jgi:RNA polymerase sigma-54 factor
MMSQSMSLQQRPEQRQILAPRMIHSMEILQLPILALQERIQQELQENPVLELKEGAGAEQATEEEGSPATADELDATNPETEVGLSEAVDKDADFDCLQALERDWEDRYHEEHRPSRNGLDEEGDKKHDAMLNLPSRPPSLQDHLSAQLAFLDCPSEQLRLLRFLITHLNKNGYLTVATEEIAKSYDQPASVAQVEDVLRLLQELEPPGVGARNEKECLLLQLTPQTRHREVVRVLITNHLEDIAHNRLPIIQRRTGFDLPTIKEAIDVLKHLTPWPGAPFSHEHIPYVVPDIAVEQTENGAYEIRLLDDWTPSMYISRRYVELCRDKGADPKAREYIKRKIQAAQWLMEAIEQRRHTLEKVTKAIIQYQRAFLDRGPQFIEPLKMQQIADHVGVHVTTVSRAVDEKWVQTPRGIFPLKRFFAGGTHTASGAEVAWETIKHKLLEIIENEDKHYPLSDEGLVNKLHEGGYPVARRTVTKYRKILNIPSCRHRKEWTA